MERSTVNRVIFVYDPISQRFVPKSDLSGVPTQGFVSGVGSTSTTVVSVQSGTVFALTDLVLTAHYSSTIATYNASGIATSPGTAVGATGPLDLLNFTINNTTTVSVTVTLTDGSGGGIIYTASVAAGALVDVTPAQPIPIANQVYAYASTSGVVNVSVTEAVPSSRVIQLVSIYDGSTQVGSVELKPGETKHISFKTPWLFKTALNVSVSTGTVDVEATGLTVV